MELIAIIIFWIIVWLIIQLKKFEGFLDDYDYRNKK